MTAELVQLQPEFAWPVKFSDHEARALVNRRLKEPADLTATLYHHPFLGLVFQGQSQRPSFFPRAGTRLQPTVLVRAHVLVDLVGGRAYLSDAWDPHEFVSIGHRDETSTITDPEPHVTEAAAVRAAHALLAGVVLRRRRMTPIDDLELVESPIRVGKPNWWVTNREASGSTEVTVDGITGRHYAFSV
ncbi:hypothetical protein GCM10009720_19470 [Yaniella flava]|uniref:Uncharacterized protein n=1 Tax=Yaniella flava TaxID=287930 RepID=A0ABP5G5B9_9MICC